MRHFIVVTTPNIWSCYKGKNRQTIQYWKDLPWDL